MYQSPQAEPSTSALPDAAALRRFSLTLLLGLPAAGLLWFLVLRVLTGTWQPRVPIAFTSLGLLLAGIVWWRPRWGERLHVGWHTATRLIETTVSSLLLIVVFYLVLTPIGLLRRRRPSVFDLYATRNRRNSYWQDPPKVKDASLYYRQF